MPEITTRGRVGVALMVLGVALFGAALLPQLAALDFLLALAALLLTAGTYTVGTDVGGRPV